MVAGEGVSLTQIAGLDPLRHDLILQALRLCPLEFISIVSMFPEPDKLLSGLSGDLKEVILSRVRLRKMRRGMSSQLHLLLLPLLLEAWLMHSQNL